MVLVQGLVGLTLITSVHALYFADSSETRLVHESQAKQRQAHLVWKQVNIAHSSSRSVAHLTVPLSSHRIGKLEAL